MKTIPLSAAIELLAKAIDIVVEEQDGIANIQLDPDSDLFLSLYVENSDGLEFVFEFMKDENVTVGIDGSYMVLRELTDPEGQVRMRLLVEMQLEASAEDVHRHQCNLKTQLNLILERCHDARVIDENGAGGRLLEIRKHAGSAKKSFDWLDNFTFLAAGTPGDRPVGQLYEVEVTETIVRKRKHFVTAQNETAAANAAVAERDAGGGGDERKTREATSTPRLLA